ncbi:BNR repeat-like domain-containing protein [Mucilaginibacter pineti]|uniref:BNR repeat-like domain-containing protein n=1 Tax=Mucilaginibacter pineti TaxID=1391627 RepID=A0A1G6X8S7_9SPHI|nr:sialidase family protein [Mucilaginibacter pineti]SDD74213.1 BNR repeat-like domain-containing protein [Mucilaginibacter pineti]
MKKVDYVHCVLISVLLIAASCGKGANNKPTDNGNGKTDPPVTPVKHADDTPPVDNSTSTVNITWDATAKKISHDVYYAEYGRVKRISATTLLLTYHCGGANDYWNNIALRRSDDNGATWGDAQILMADNIPGYYGFSNPDILVMKNGWLMLAFVGRGNPDDNAHDNVQIRISKDQGLSWGDPKIIATGRSWEPGAIQLSDGDIELFYSSEANWWPSSNPQQDILFIHSTDNGATWSSPKEVAYASGFRDGMPTPLVLKDNKGIVFPIESVNNSKSPWVLWSSTDAKWNYNTNGTTSNGRRWLATTNNVFGGGPYMVQLSTGETLLSFQDGDGRAISDWKKSTMLVLQGNSVGANFSKTTRPWPNLPLNEGAYYSSMFLKDDNTVVLITTRNFSDNHSEIYWKEGHITR